MKYQISNLLDELQSNEAYIRSGAIKKIVKENINNERIIVALDNIIENDPSPAIRDFAQSALNVFGIKHSVNKTPVAINPKKSIHKIPQTSKSNTINSTNTPRIPTKGYTVPQTIIEKTVLDNSVKISSTKVVFGQSTGDRVFLISDITSAHLIQPSFPVVTAVVAPITILIGFLVIAFSCVMSINFDLAGYSIFGILLIGAAVYAIFPTYTVELVISLERFEVFASKNFAKCKTIVDRLNEEISRREKPSVTKSNHVS